MFVLTCCLPTFVLPGCTGRSGPTAVQRQRRLSVSGAVVRGQLSPFGHAHQHRGRRRARIQLPLPLPRFPRSLFHVTVNCVHANASRSSLTLSIPYHHLFF